jgi:hypothetical protein
MSDAPEEEVSKAAKTARKRPARRVTKTAPVATETVVNLSAPEPLAPAAPVETVSAPAEAVERQRSSRPPVEDSDHGDPVATMGEPPSSDSQGGGSKKRRRRKKNKHGQAAPQGGGSQQVFQTAPTQGYSGAGASQETREPREPREREREREVQNHPPEQPHGHASVMHAAPRPKLDYDEVARKAWKIFLAEVSEEGLALIGDNDARELSRRSFRLAEVFVEEAARRQSR